MTIRSMEGPWNGIQLKINGLAHTQSVNADPTGADDQLRFEIHGDNGALHFNSMDPNYWEAYDCGARDTPLGGSRGRCKVASVRRCEKPGGFPGPKFSIGWIRAHLHSYYKFLESVANGKQSQPSLQDGLRL